MSDNRSYHAGATPGAGHSSASARAYMSRHGSSNAAPGFSPTSSASPSHTPMGFIRRADARGRGQGQHYGERPFNTRGGSFMGGQDRRPPFSARGGASLAEDGTRTKLASYVTPHDAVQAQPAQHGATIVRSGSAATEGGSILFFSSVQKKGGAFTATERETYAQLRQSRAIPNSNRNTRGGGSVVGSGIMTRNVARQFEELERAREAKEIGVVKNSVKSSKRSRFELESDEDMSGSEGSGESGDSVEERKTKSARGEAEDAQSSSESDDA